MNMPGWQHDETQKSINKLSQDVFPYQAVPKQRLLERYKQSPKPQAPLPTATQSKTSTKTNSFERCFPWVRQARLNYQHLTTERHPLTHSEPSRQYRGRADPLRQVSSEVCPTQQPHTIRAPPLSEPSPEQRAGLSCGPPQFKPETSQRNRRCFQTAASQQWPSEKKPGIHPRWRQRACPAAAYRYKYEKPHNMGMTERTNK